MGSAPGVFRVLFCYTYFPGEFLMAGRETEIMQRAVYAVIAEGQSQLSTAKKFGVSRSALIVALRRHGLQPKARTAAEQPRTP